MNFLDGNQTILSLFVGTLIGLAIAAIAGRAKKLADAFDSRGELLNYYLGHVEKVAGAHWRLRSPTPRAP